MRHIFSCGFRIHLFDWVTNSFRLMFKRNNYVKLIVLFTPLVLILIIFLRNEPNTVYRHYNIRNTNNEGLKTSDSQEFILNGKPLIITCGLMYYFRVHPYYWRDRLRKLRAMGAVAVKIMVPWNLHEPYKDIYDFGNGTFEMSQFLDIVKFIQIAKEEDLLVMVGLGPYINADMDFGGLPSYLIGNKIKIRTSHFQFLARVEKYFKELLALLKPLEIEKGGPIIMFQIENSYGIVREEETDSQYLPKLKTIIEENKIKSLLFTSDSVSASWDKGSLSHLGVLQTTNSETDVLSQLETLQTLHPQSPRLIHLRTGYLDHWNRPQHNSWLPHEFEAALKEAIEFPASVSLHVFHGGTNFGFISGVTSGDTPDNYHPQITSYDYDAPLSEAGDYTPKYKVALEVFRGVHPLLHHPTPPPLTPRTLSLSLPLTAELPWRDIVQQLHNQLTEVSHFVHLEDLPALEDGRRQNHGYVLYSFKVRVMGKWRMKIVGRKRDIVMVLLNGVVISGTDISETNHFGFWDSDNDEMDYASRPGTYLMELLVENCGRFSFANSLSWMEEKKGMGISNKVIFKNAVPVSKINITGLPFHSSWILSLTGWKNRISYETKPAPSFVKTTFELTREQITDTFLDIGHWRKGFVVVNGFNIGRYFCNSPQQTLYIPAPLLKPGSNTSARMNFIINIVRQSLFTNATPMTGNVSQLAKTFLQPPLPTLNLINGFKMKFAVKRRCRDCWLEIRDGRLYNLCKTHPRHKQMSWKTHEKKKRILTWAGQSRKRPW